MTKPYSAHAIILDPSSFFIDGLERCLGRSGHRVIARASQLAEVQQTLGAFVPTLALVGPNFPEVESLALCRTLQTHWSDIKLILYSPHAHDCFFQADAVSVGVHACLPCNADMSETLEAVSAALAGRLWFSPEVLSHVLNRRTLTRREHEVLKLLAEGKMDKEIAARLGLSLATARVHAQHVLEKLQVHTRAEAVRRARRLGWVF